MTQFLELYRFLASDGLVYLLPTPRTDGLQDLVFTANLGLVLGHLDPSPVVVSNFSSPPRRREDEVGFPFFDSMGYRTHLSPHRFEGEADLKHLHDDVYVGGYGLRSERAASEWMEREFDMRIAKVRETDPYLYHLDCTVFPLTREDTLVCTEMFEREEVAAIERHTNIIDVSVDECLQGVCNSVRLSNTLLNASHIHELRAGTEEYRQEVRKNRRLEDVAADLAMEVYFNLAEYVKGGALLSCMVMHLNRHSYASGLSEQRAGPRFELRPRGPYSLLASARFLEGFAPAAHEGAGDHLHLAFPGPHGQGAGVCLREEAGVVVGEVFGPGNADWVGSEIERILSLDVDGSGFPAVGERDPVIGRLQWRFEGLRPVLFLSPYEAGAWALISHRLRIVQAARLKVRLAEELGEAVDIHGDVRHASPAPERLAGLEDFRGLFGRKVEWLRALSEAAREGRLDADHLRALTGEKALAELKALPGIGDFSAQLILLRGAGEPDHLPTAEPRLRRAVARAYGMGEEPSQDEIAELSKAWRPYRTWAAVLLRAFLEKETKEIEGRRG